MDIFFTTRQDKKAFITSNFNKLLATFSKFPIIRHVKRIRCPLLCHPQVVTFSFHCQRNVILLKETIKCQTGNIFLRNCPCNRAKYIPNINLTISRELHILYIIIALWCIFQRDIWTELSIDSPRFVSVWVTSCKQKSVLCSAYRMSSTCA